MRVDNAEPGQTTTMSATATADATPFAGFVEFLDGTAGTVTYKAELPQLKGGDATVRDKFNAGMRAALDDYLKPTDDNVPVTVAPGVLNEDDRSEVSHIGTGAVAGVLLLNIFVDHAAHPFNAVATTVIDAHTAEPIMITDLFADQTAGLTALVDGVKSAMATDEKLANQSRARTGCGSARQLAARRRRTGRLHPGRPRARRLLPGHGELGTLLTGVLAPGMREKLTK